MPVVKCFTRVREREREYNTRITLHVCSAVEYFVLTKRRSENRSVPSSRLFRESASRLISDIVLASVSLTVNIVNFSDRVRSRAERESERGRSM